MVGAGDELVQWPHEHRFFIRDCGILYISLTRISTAVSHFQLSDIEKEERIPRSPLSIRFFRQSLFQQRTSPVLAVIADGHIYEITGAYEDVGRGGTGIHRVQQFSVE